MISVRSHRTTYLCLEDDSYTGLYTDLSRREQSTTHLTVLCSISFPYINYTQNCCKSHSDFTRLTLGFHHLSVSQATAAKWRLI